MGIGTCDAAGPGMGGVWFVPGSRPLLWRSAFPIDVQQQLVTFEQPNGTKTNSDLELAGIIAQKDVLAQLRQYRYERLLEILESTIAKKRIATKKWQKVLGELLSMVYAMPGAKGLFNTLQSALSQTNDGHRIRINSRMRSELEDFRSLAYQLHTLVPR